MPPLPEIERRRHYTSFNKGILRNKFTVAQEQAKTFNNVIDDGQVIHFLTAIDTELHDYGVHIMKGYPTLETLAFLMEEDIDTQVPTHLRVRIYTCSFYSFFTIY